MNKVILMGRLARDPEVRYSQGENSTAIARYTLAVNRRRGRNEENAADFISCVAFGKSAEFAEKYLRKGIKITLSGRIQTGSYTNRDGVKVYTTDVVVEEQEFAESRANSDAREQGGGNNSYQGQNQGYGQQGQGQNYGQSQNRGQGQNQNRGGGNQNNSYQGYGGTDGFMDIPDGIDDELPFN